MKANVFYGSKDLRLEELPVPDITEDELLVHVEACAVCGSDVRTYHHGARNITRPIIMGHEAVGTVVKVGAAITGYSGGQRVAVAPAVPCCVCRYCQRGAHTVCDNLRSIGYEFHGGFAEYMVAPSSAVRAGCVNPIPGNLSFVEATLAEPLACAINSQELLNVTLGDSVLVVEP